MREAKNRLEDAEWCRQASYVSGLRTAVAEWNRIVDGEDRPWVESDEDDEGTSPSVIPDR